MTKFGILLLLATTTANCELWSLHDSRSIFNNVFYIQGGASGRGPCLVWHWQQSCPFHPLALLLCQYCLILICLSRMWLTVEHPKTKSTQPKSAPRCPILYTHMNSVTKSVTFIQIGEESRCVMAYISCPLRQTISLSAISCPPRNASLFFALEIDHIALHWPRHSWSLIRTDFAFLTNLSWRLIRINKVTVFKVSVSALFKKWTWRSPFGTRQYSATPTT